MDALLKTMTTVLSFVTEIFTWISANPLMLFLLACSLVPAGFGIFRAAKNSVQ